MAAPTIHCQSCPVWKQSIFRRLESELLDTLAQEKTALALEEGQELFVQGQAAEGIFCLAEGLIRVQQKSPKGRSRFIRLALPGETAGHRSIFIDKTYKGTAKVISKEAKACFISKNSVLSLLATSAEFAKRLVQRMAAELNRSEEDRLAVKERTVRSRLAELLEVLGQRYAENTSTRSALLKSELSKVELAGILGVADETVIRLMSELKNDGLIEYRDRRIHILDSERLGQISAQP